MKLFYTTSLAFVAASGLAFSQGSDSCASAQAISGSGNYAFDNNGASTDGLPDPSCLKFGTDQVNNDVWFVWTSDTTGLVTVSTCGNTGLDTKLAVYNNGACPPSGPLDCNDDTCGLQSEVSFTATNGNQYLVRVGTFSAAAFGSGSFDIGPPPPPVGNDACSGALAIAGTGTFPYDTTTATTDGLGDVLCDKFGTDQVNRDVWFLWTAPSSATFQIETCGLTGHDSKLAVYDDLSCPPSNPLDCNDDTCGLQSTVTFSGNSGQDYLIRVGGFSAAVGGSGDFMISDVGGPPTIGVNFCATLPNSTTLPAALTAMGSQMVVNQSLSLTSSDMPANVNGIFYYGTAPAPGLGFGDGVRCVAGAIQRLPFLAANGSGVMTEPDVFGQPMPNVGISGGNTFYFQSWFRDPAGLGMSGFNLSNGLSILFQ